jgi:hypothetical protein
LLTGKKFRHSFKYPFHIFELRWSRKFNHVMFESTEPRKMASQHGWRHPWAFWYKSRHLNLSSVGVVRKTGKSLAIRLIVHANPTQRSKTGWWIVKWIHASVSSQS